MIKKLSSELYEQILENMPICCVDIVLHKNEKILLIRRKEEPARGEWWVIGGRILKGERFEEAVKRKIKEEAGVGGKIEKQIGVYEVLFDKEDSFDVRRGTHAIAIVYLAEASEEEVILDETSTEYKWIDQIEESWHPYVKKVLRDSGVFK